MHLREINELVFPSMPKTINPFFFSIYFQLVEKFEHVQSFQLLEINFRLAEKVNFFVIPLHNLLISRNRIRLKGFN